MAAKRKPAPVAYIGPATDFELLAPEGRWRHPNDAERQALDRVSQKRDKPDVHQLFDYHTLLFERTVGRRPVYTPGKDGATFKRLLATVPLVTEDPVDCLKTLLDRFFDSSDTFIMGSGYTVGAFASQVNKLLVEAARPATKDLSPRMQKNVVALQSFVNRHRATK